MKYSLYLHIPFCKSRCHYCDFNTYAGMGDHIPAYMDALKNEFRIAISQYHNSSFHSIYIGGGTPSLIPIEYYQSFLKVIKENINLSQDCEINLEANPGTLSLPYLQELKRLGANRLSIGVQSTDTFDLTRLDRIHSVEEVLTSFTNARRAGFDNLNLDLIFGLPWQDLNSWENSLSRAIALKPEHFSLYSLIIEPGTPLAGWSDKGLIKIQDQDLEADMYELAIEMLADVGYEHYEISNWALQSPDRDYRSRHNLQYWRNLPYFGLGAGAHGYVESVRTVNAQKIPDYIQRMKNPEPDNSKSPGSPATISRYSVDQITQRRDYMMLGLRLIKEGVNRTDFKRRYGLDMSVLFQTEIELLLGQRLVERVEGDEGRLRLSKRGIMLANRVFREFV